MTDPLAGLRLWQRANVLYCFIVFPVFILLFYYADIFIRVLFTEQYVAAVTLFQILLLFMVRQCFGMSPPLRAMNQNKYFVRGNSIAFVLNVCLIYVLFNAIGIEGPAAALVLSDIVLVIYLGNRILKVYAISLRHLFMWRKIGTLLMGTLLGVPVLLGGELIPGNNVVVALACSLCYGFIYYGFIRRSKLEEVELVMSRLSRKLGWA